MTNKSKSSRNGHYRQAPEDRERFVLSESLYDKMVLGWIHGGFTFNIDGSSPHFEPDEWIVALKGFQWCTPFLPSRDLINTYFHEYEKFVRSGNYFIGGWMSDGLYYLDVSTVRAGKNAAILLGQKEQQLAIFCPASGKPFEVFKFTPVELINEVVKRFEAKLKATLPPNGRSSSQNSERG